MGKKYPVRQNLNDRISPYVLAQKLDGFYTLEEDSLDVAFLGASYMHCSINPLIIWNEYGYTSYDLTADQQDMETAYYYCEELFKTQKPQKVAVTCNFTHYLQDKPAAHFTFDFMPFSISKLKGILKRAPEGEVLPYLIAYPDYHTRWTELTEDDFQYLTYQREHTFNGYFAYCVEASVVPQENQRITTFKELPEEDKECIDKFYRLCTANGAELIIMRTPSAIGNDFTETMNAIRAYVKDKNIKVIDYSFDDRMNIDWEKDFADQVHANIYGAEKISSVVGGDFLEGLVIKQQNQSVIDQYNTKYQLYRSYVDDYEFTKITDMDLYLEAIQSNKDYTAFIVGKGDHTMPLDHDRYQSGEDNRWSYIRVIDSQETIIEEQGDSELGYSEEIDGIMFELVSNSDEEGTASIVMDYDQELCLNTRGLNVVVYNKVTQDVIDVKCFDIYQI